MWFLVSCYTHEFIDVNNPLAVDHDGDGFTIFLGDCDDSNPYVYPGAAELESSEDCMKDEDEDGYGDMNITEFPDNDGYSGIDCDDNAPNTVDDMDCDGILSVDDCDDGNKLNANICISITLSSGTEIYFSKISGSNLIDPLGRYTLDNPFYMMTTEVTQGMFEEVMGYDFNEGQSINYGIGDNHPAYYINWHMAAHFSNTLSILEGEEECYTCSGSKTNVTCNETMDPYLCTGFSLPTDHEWEISARSGTTSDFWTGEGNKLGGSFSSNDCNPSVTIRDGVNNPLLSDYAWFCSNNGFGAPEGAKDVGQLLPNGFGLYDMHGNLREWISDWAQCTYPNSGTWCDSGQGRVLRGGNWESSPIEIGSSRRGGSSPTSQGGSFGFRLRKIIEL